jgi:predicted enzyme related to lactoylglutathione lyase
MPAAAACRIGASRTTILPAPGLLQLHDRPSSKFCNSRIDCRPDFRNDSLRIATPEEMEAPMSAAHGSFVWHELMTSDPTAARAFYSNVVGWTVQASPIPGMDYWMFKAGETPVGGLMKVPEEAVAQGARPMWVGYVGVDDVDAATEKAKQLGGVVYRPPADIPNMGRFSIIGDPQRTMLALFTFANPMPGESPAQGTRGHVGWNELYATDWQQAFDFYAAMFGWRKDQAMDMGPMGTYQLFAHGEHAIGGMMNKPSQMPMTSWNYYFNVEDIDGAAERVKAGGGQVINGPMQVPGGSWIAQAVDPQGAMFALVGMRA